VDFAILQIVVMQIHDGRAKSATMLELRPVCENCAKPLPPPSAEAMICTFECTFCAACVASVLANVCPNCGGGFEKRPVRPNTNWRGDNDLAHHPATMTVKHRPVDANAHAAFIAKIGAVAPEDR
jgi:hypothetical protein